MTAPDKGRREPRSVLPKVPQSETLQSLNHLYQSAVYSAIRSSIQQSTYGESRQKSVQLQSLAKKSTLRLDSTIKRSLCQRCNVPLLPGITSRIHSRTFAPSSRAIQTKCLLCSFIRRVVAPPCEPQNSNKYARRRRIRQAEELRQSTDAKAVKFRLADPMPTLSTSTSTTVENANASPEPKRRLSQRARRRAGKAKAQLMSARSINDASESVVFQDDRSTIEQKGKQRKTFAKLPRYTQRFKGDKAWANSSWASDMSPHEKEAILLLRGDHLQSSGLGRGGQVGKLQDSPSHL